MLDWYSYDYDLICSYFNILIWLICSKARMGRHLVHHMGMQSLFVCLFVQDFHGIAQRRILC